MAEQSKENTRHFCIMCFADDQGGSWAETTHPSAGFCANCGSGCSLIAIPAYAVEEIRKNASWVGKRYYPSDEDKDLATELLLLRSKMPHNPPGRIAERSRVNPGQWLVTQVIHGKGSSITVLVEDAASEEDALKKAQTRLPYVEVTGV